MKYFLEGLKKYGEFEGRASRAEYWMFMIISNLIGLGIGIVCKIMGSDSTVLSNLFSLFVFLPSLAVSVRRMYDINKNGWTVLISFIPFIGWIWFLILACTEGDSQSNEYGNNPYNI